MQICKYVLCEKPDGDYTCNGYCDVGKLQYTGVVNRVYKNTKKVLLTRLI